MKVRYFAWIKDITKTDVEEIDNLLIKDTKDLTKLICTKYPKLESYFEKNIICMAINLEHITSSKKLSPDDEVAFFPPVSGG